MKKTAIQKTRIPEANIFFVRELHDKHFDTTWHAHSEYQLFLVVEGTGTKFIGNTVKPFDKGDLTFLGPHIPHLWRSDESYFELPAEKSCVGLVIYINPAALNQWIDKEEFTQLKTLLEKVRRGMEICGKTAQKTATLMQELIHLHGMESMIHLLRIFDLIAKSKEYRLLHDDIAYNQPKDVETNRINTVYNYAARRFKHKITLEEVSALLNMTPTSFSRYFTMKTSKSFSYFLTELRIRNACKQLSTEEGKTIAQICYESGFNTLSNFNKQFKTFIGMTPTAYRQKFLTL
ncbi:AraC family transcriptional regulator [Parapedobacter sp. DT-150]|uniref:AraC family transcriptional regulator n=1 Tax=Parapedobacter sp. DT-150 TaxID=3396162 RepID=UPI003F1CA588